MIKVNIVSLLKKNNKTKYWLCKKMGIGYNPLNKIINGETSSISFKYIDDFCRYLKCTPAELFTYEEDDISPELEGII